MSTASAESATLRRTRSAVVALVMSEIMGKSATFVMFLVAARLLGIAQFGVFTFGWSLGLLLSVIPSLGLDARVLQLGSVRPESLDRSFGALVAIRVVLAAATMAVTSVVTLAATGPTANTLTILMLVAAFLIDPLNDACRTACGVLQKQEFPAAVMVFQRVAALVLSVGLAVRFHAAWGAALGYLLGCAVGVACMFLAARRAGARARIREGRSEVSKILRAAPVLGLEAVSTMGLFRLDAALIAMFLGTTAVGVYGASYRIFETMLFVSWTLSRAFIPVIASRPDDAEHVRTWSRRCVVLVVSLYLPYGTALAIRGDALVGRLYGQEFISRGLMPALAFAPLLFGLAHLSGSILVSRRPDPRVVVASLSALVVNVGLDVVLLPRIGINGAGYATSLAFLLQSTILIMGIRRFVGRLGVSRQVALVAAASGAAAATMLVVGPLLPSLLAGGVAYGVVWLVLVRIFDPSMLLGLRRARTPEQADAAEPAATDVAAAVR